MALTRKYADKVWLMYFVLKLKNNPYWKKWDTDKNFLEISLSSGICIERCSLKESQIRYEMWKYVHLRVWTPEGSNGLLWNSLRLTVSLCLMLKIHGRWLVHLLGLIFCCLKSLIRSFKEQPGHAVSKTFCNEGG